MPEMITAATAIWKKFMPHQPIRYSFLDESFAQMYMDVQRTGQIFGTFAALAIAVACLGLFALSAFMIEQRGKEISVRLVLGASVNSILKLLANNFIRLVIVSFIISIPIAWYMTTSWLEDYTYRVALTWDVFVLAGVMVLMIALLTISYQSFKAALVNPAKSLRSE